MNIPNLLISSAIGAIVGSSVGYAIARFQNRRKPTQNELNKKENIKRIWLRAKDIYKNAVKIKELNPKYGRIQRVKKILETLNNDYPDLPKIKPILGYLYWLQGDSQKAFEYYQDSSPQNLLKLDWYNISIIALSLEKHEVARDSLDRYFNRSEIIENFFAWRFYIDSCIKVGHYSFLINWLKLQDNAYNHDELISLFKTGLYFLNSVQKEPESIELLLAKQRKVSLNELVEETYQRITKAFRPDLSIKAGRLNGYIFEYHQQKEEVP